jgi:hypothetical protein
MQKNASSSRKTYHVGGRIFATQKSLIEFVQGILHRPFVGRSLAEDEFQFMLSLIDRHQEREQKIGVGVADIRIAVNPKYKNRMFEITRLDGSTTDFSYRVCIRPTTSLDNFIGACRAIASEQVKQYKVERFSHAGADGRIACDLSGRMVTMKEAHVDHEPPATFDRLRRDFVVAIGLDPEQVVTTGHADNETVLGFADPAVADAFARFHRERARLRLLSIGANLSDTRRGAQRVL